MGINEPEIKKNKYISFNLKLEKVCYLPGEKICGNIILEGKPGLKETQLIDPKALIIIKQKQKYDYSDSENQTQIEKIESFLYKNYLAFNSFIGANLLTKINIPFSIVLPINSYPSCSFKDGGYIKHSLSIEFQVLKVKRTIKIVVKNNPNFTIQNKLLKIPCKSYLQKSKSKFLVNKGNFNLLVNLPKNVFYYDEPIPYEIILNCENLKLKINTIIVSLFRNRKRNYSYKCNKAREEKKEEIINKNFKINHDLKEHIIKDVLSFPNSLGVSLHLDYRTIEKNGPYMENVEHFEKLFYLAPSCRGGLLSVEYYIKIKIMFDALLTFDEVLVIPVDFCSRPDQKQINNNMGEIGFVSSNVSDKSANIINTDEVTPYQFDKPQHNMESNENKMENKTNELNEQNSNVIQQFDNLDLNESGCVAPPPVDFNANMKNI